MPPTVKPPREIAAVFGFVSVVMIASAAASPPSTEHGRNGSAQPGEKAVERQPDADDAGGEDDDLLGLQLEEPGGFGGRGERVELAPLSGRGVRHARVDDDRLRLGLRDVVAVDEQAGAPGPGCG